jgi:hypothetical protein
MIATKRYIACYTNTYRKDRCSKTIVSIVEVQGMKSTVSILLYSSISDLDLVYV